MKKAAPALEAESVTVRFGGLTALEGISLRLEPQTILGVIGPNGAGKTTLVNVLSGFQRQSNGRVLLDGTCIDGLKPEARARRGLVRTFQSVRLFRDLPVISNVVVSGLASGVGKAAADRRARKLLDWAGVLHLADRRGEALSYSDERMVGIARVLALEPKYILLDEPAAGMTERESEVLLEKIIGIPPGFGCGVLLIEHNMRIVMAAAHRVHVIEFGRTIAEGSPADVMRDRRVIEAYLGAESQDVASYRAN
jgi:branched-chain amino acid transport system ATP-binding protein